MNNQLINFSTVSTILFASSIAFAQVNQIGTLTVEVSNLESNMGQVLVQLFRETDKVPSGPFIVLKSTIVNNKATVDFENIVFGDYAIIAVHDLNSNGIIDHKWGFPSEPLGYSNSWKLNLLSGMPTFDKLKFVFERHNQNYSIKMPG